MPKNIGAHESVLAQLHQAVTDGLLARIQSGEATPADYAQAIKLLKDNEISCQGTKNQSLLTMRDSLPFDEEGNELN